MDNQNEIPQGTVKVIKGRTMIYSDGKWIPACPDCNGTGFDSQRTTRDGYNLDCRRCNGSGAR